MKITKITERHIQFTVPENSDYDVHMGLILGDKHNFIVDTGMGASNMAAVLNYIDSLGSAHSKPLVAINTHHDFDHVLGNYTLKDYLIVAHRLCYEALRDGFDERSQGFIQENRDFIDGEIIAHPPNLTFEDSLHFHEDGIVLFHSPGHTKDSISVYDSKEKVLYIGDNFGIFDGVLELWAKDLQDFEQTLNRYKQHDIDICVLSHSDAYRGELITLLEVALIEAQQSAAGESKNILTSNLEHLHTTELGIERIRKNLNLDTDDIVAWCKDRIKADESKVVQKGKNLYVSTDDCTITINVRTLSIITAHKAKAK